MKVHISIVAIAVMCISIPVTMGVIEHHDSTEMYYTATVHGDSMYPVLTDGTNIIIESKNAPGFNIFVGDIVVYWSPMKQISVAHRIVDIKYINGEPYYYTKGDNNAYIDAVVPPNDIEGKVICIT